MWEFASVGGDRVAMKIEAGSPGNRDHRDEAVHDLGLRVRDRHAVLHAGGHLLLAVGEGGEHLVPPVGGHDPAGDHDVGELGEHARLVLRPDFRDEEGVGKKRGGVFGDVVHETLPKGWTARCAGRD